MVHPNKLLKNYQYFMYGHVALKIQNLHNSKLGSYVIQKHLVPYDHSKDSTDKVNKCMPF